MTSKRTPANIALTMGSFALAFALLMLTEFLVRLTTDVGRLGTATDLFVNHAYGTSIGNSPDVITTAFGVEVRIDKQGFRTDPVGTVSAQADQPVIMILGDSVAFGVGVQFEDTLAARLATAFPDRLTYNTAVIGYGVNDYLNVAKALIPRLRDSLDQVLLIMCLNDVSVVSAANIRATVAGTDNRWMMRSAGIDVQSLRDNAFVNSMNSYLRSRSSLYVWARGTFTDPQSRYWQDELANYRELSKTALAKILEPITEVAELADASGVRLSVFITPFAGQMNPNESSLPQEKLATFFVQNGIHHVDLLPRFRMERSPINSFLPFDPMHLSPQGHEVLFRTVLAQLTQTTTD